MEQQLSNAAVALVGVAAVGSLGTWTIIAQRLRQQGEVLPSLPRLTVPWTGWHVMLVFFSANLLPTFAYPINGVKLGTPIYSLPADKAAILIGCLGLISLATALLGALIVKILTQANLRDFGVSLNFRRMTKDLVIGSLGFMAATLPVLGVQFGVSQLVEYDHPVLDMLKGRANELMWIAALFSAVLVAPLIEELLFRVLLQGWMERLALGKKTGIFPPEQQPAKPEDSETEFKSELDQLNPYAAANSRPAGSAVPVREPVAARAIWPIWVSAAIFALMHLGQGAAPIPLLLLGAILGYLYRQTHRLVPCVVLHALFNLFSLLIFRLSVQ